MILDQLKHLSRPDHERVQAHPRVSRLTDERLSLAEYAAFLATMAGFYLPLEQQLGGFGEWAQIGLDFEQRRKTSLLLRDLTALGYAPGDVRLCTDLPAISTFPQAVGCMYVLEGATLGGQLIARQMAARFGLTAERGAAFYRSYGDAVGPMWKMFCARVNAYAAARGDADGLIIASANETFRTLEQWLGKEDVVYA